MRMTSAFNKNGDFPDAASSEIWGSECRVEDGVGRIGGIFLAIALVAFVFGTTLELFMFRYVRRRRKSIKFSSSSEDNTKVLSAQDDRINNPFDFSDEDGYPIGYMT